MTSAYIYYRIDPGQAHLAASRIDALLRIMAMHCRTVPRRLCRCDDPDTWMEVYEDIIDFTVFSRTLTTNVEDCNCTDFISGARHLECFNAPTPLQTDQ